MDQNLWQLKILITNEFITGNIPIIHKHTNRRDFINLFKFTSVPRSWNSGTERIYWIEKAPVHPHVTCWKNESPLFAFTIQVFLNKRKFKKRQFSFYQLNLLCNLFIFCLFYLLGICRSWDGDNIEKCVKGYIWPFLHCVLGILCSLLTYPLRIILIACLKFLIYFAILDNIFGV